MSAAVDGLRIAESIVEELMAGGKGSQTASEQAAILDLTQAIGRLRAGAPLLFPTDTVFGLGAAVLHAGSPAALNGLKGREGSQPVAWLVADEADLDRFGASVPAYAHALARAFWPGALTLIVVAADRVPPAFRAPDGTVALRMPAHAAALTLIEGAESPIATTSANMSGEDAPRTAAEVSEALASRVPLFDAESEGSGRASTIVDCTGDAPRIVREGGVPTSAIEEVSSAR